VETIPIKPFTLSSEINVMGATTAAAAWPLHSLAGLLQTMQSFGGRPGGRFGSGGVSTGKACVAGAALSKADSGAAAGKVCAAGLDTGGAPGTTGDGEAGLTTVEIFGSGFFSIAMV
jgi:hypothetical protein